MPTRAVGASDLRIILRHVLPNAISSVAVAATVMTVGAIVVETTLAYLGFGISTYGRGEQRTPAHCHQVAEDKRSRQLCRRRNRRRRLRWFDMI